MVTPAFTGHPSATFMGSLSLLLKAQETSWSRGIGKALSVQAPFRAADPKVGTGAEAGDAPLCSGNSSSRGPSHTHQHHTWGALLAQKGGAQGTEEDLSK